MKEVHILLIEDNEGDIILTKEAFRMCRIKNTLSIVRDGEEALNYLNKEGVYFAATPPDLILLDINIPKINGREVLRAVKEKADLKDIPVIMLTTSSSSEDILDAYSKKADCYLIKPIDSIKFIEAVAEIDLFWFSLMTRRN